jgi:hypothetical protein
MTPSKLAFALVIVPLLAACEHDSNVGTEVDAPAANNGTCPLGSDRLVIDGAFTVDTQTIGFVTVAGKVIGVAGQHAGKTIGFTVRDALGDDLDALGDHDVATKNMKHLESPPGTECETAPIGTCRGFFALAGTFTVSQVQPRYRATFTLTELHERHDSTDQLGAPIAGTVTGCLDVQAP